MKTEHPSRHRIPALRALWRQAFGDSEEYLDVFFRTGFSPERCLCLTEGPQTAAALYWFDCLWNGEPIAYLYAVATEASLQGRGYGTRLLQDTHTYLKQAGYAGSILVPAEPALFAFYERLGYRACCGLREFSCCPGSTPEPLTRLTAAEYGDRRRLLLPVGSVIQEGATLEFLSTQARFYSADDCIFCAQQDGNTILVKELLGSPRRAPEIIAALHGRQGLLRVPGTGRPFAMYLPFFGNPEMPAYFGLALD